MENRVTINEALSLLNVAKGKLSNLYEIKSRVAVERTTFWDDKRVEEKAQFDPGKIDQKISEIEEFIFRTNAAIKGSNAITKIEITQGISDLLAPIVLA